MTGNACDRDVAANTTPRVLALDANAYHNDTTGDDRPALSKSIIQTLLNESPAHARHNHPKLNPNFTRAIEEKFDLGTVTHDLFLEGYDRVAIVPFDDWRKKAAQELRDVARAHGQIPLLAKDAERVQDMLVALKARLKQAEAIPSLFTDGQPEQTIVWEDRGVLCKARLDWLRNDRTTIDDLKTTGASANPDAWCRKTLWSVGADVQACFYARGCEQVFGQRPEFRFVVIEAAPPYAMSVVAMGPAVLELAEKKIDWALDRWRRCLERDEWPAYPAQVAYAELPPWIESQWLARELREVGA